MSRHDYRSMSHPILLLIINLLLWASIDCSAQSDTAFDSSVFTIAEYQFDTTVFTVVEHPPEFPGGSGALTEYLLKNVQYPPEAKKAISKDRVYVSFIVEVDGTRTNIQILKGLGYGCDEEAVRVVQAMPRWVPGRQSGKPIRVKYNLPIPFNQASFTINEGVYPIGWEQEPQFPGGPKALQEYLRQNVRYPEAAARKKVKGKVWVSFVIDTAGYVSNPTILKGLGYGCDEEAIRVVREMPRWQPGIRSGRVVPAKYNLPIAFTLE